MFRKVPIDSYIEDSIFKIPSNNNDLRLQVTTLQIMAWLQTTKICIMKMDLVMDYMFHGKLGVQRPTSKKNDILKTNGCLKTFYEDLF